MGDLSGKNKILSLARHDKNKIIQAGTGSTEEKQARVCYSLAEKTLPTDIPLASDSNLEMSWYTFGGEYYEVYEALVKAWCISMGLETDDETVSKYFRLNLERGISYLCGTGFIKSIDDLLHLVVK